MVSTLTEYIQGYVTIVIVLILKSLLSINLYLLYYKSQSQSRKFCILQQNLISTAELSDILLLSSTPSSN